MSEEFVRYYNVSKPSGWHIGTLEGPGKRKGTLRVRPLKKSMRSIEIDSSMVETVVVKQDRVSCEGMEGTSLPAHTVDFDV